MPLAPDAVTDLSDLRAAPPALERLATLLAMQGDAATALHRAADRLRREIHGDPVFLRGIIEFSNICRNHCAYCGIRADNRSVERYRMSPEAIFETAAHAKRWGCTTVVLQSGVDAGFGLDRLAELIRRIQDELGLAVTLSIGTQPRATLEKLRAAGADRYLLRFETCEPELFAQIHPDETFAQRVQCLRDLRDVGFQVGSGFMIALPGWTPESIAREIRFATALQLDMIGCGPFLASPGTPLAGTPRAPDSTLYYNTMALLRLCNPRAHIPATTAFDALDPDGRNRVLQCGANVFMPNVTPGAYRRHYQLYPGKPCVDEDGAACARCVRARLVALGRTVGDGPGHALPRKPGQPSGATADGRDARPSRR